MQMMSVASGCIAKIPRWLHIQCFYLFIIPSFFAALFQLVDPVHRVFCAVRRCQCALSVCKCVSVVGGFACAGSGHKCQLMTITLIRSSIQPRAQGPIHPPLFTHSPSSLSHCHWGELSLTPDTLHTRQNGHADACTLNALLRTH